MNELERFSVKQLLEMFLINIRLILVVSVLCAVAFFTYSQTMLVPLYRSSVSLYINNIDSSMKFEDKMLGTDISASQMLVPSCVEIVKSNRMLNEVADSDGLDYSAAQIAGMLSVKVVEETEIFEVSITCASPQDAAKIADTFAKVVPDVVGKIIGASTVKVIDYARVSNIKVYPNVVTNTLSGFLVGLFLSCAFITIREIFDVRIKNEVDIEREFDYPILGVIPKIGTRNSGQESYYYRNSYYRYRKGGYHYGREDRSNRK